MTQATTTLTRAGVQDLELAFDALGQLTARTAHHPRDHRCLTTEAATLQIRRLTRNLGVCTSYPFPDAASHGRPSTAGLSTLAGFLHAVAFKPLE